MCLYFLPKYIRSYVNLLWLLLLPVTGCTPALVVHQNFNPTANFGQYRTYRWHSANISGLDQQIGNRELVERSVKIAVESELVKRGMGPDTASPDLLIAYYVSVGADQEGVTTNPSSLNYGFSGIPGFRDDNNYREGTLIIDLIEAGTNELVWRGWAEAEVDADNLTESKIIRVVVNILSQYPPGAPGR